MPPDEQSHVMLVAAIPFDTERNLCVFRVGSLLLKCCLSFITRLKENISFTVLSIHH